LPSASTPIANSTVAAAIIHAAPIRKPSATIDSFSVPIRYPRSRGPVMPPIVVATP